MNPLKPIFRAPHSIRVVPQRFLVGLTWLTVVSGFAGCASEPPILTFFDVGNQRNYRSYYIEIYKDGTVHYHGNRDVNAIGDRYGTISPEQVNEMVSLYKGLYRSHEKMLNEFFWPKYRNRYELSPEKRAELERYKESYADNIFGPQSIVFHDGGHVSQYAPAGGYYVDLIGILNGFIDLERWICLHDNNPDNEYCQPRDHSPGFKLLMERIK